MYIFVPKCNLKAFSIMAKTPKQPVHDPRDFLPAQGSTYINDSMSDEILGRETIENELQSIATANETRATAREIAYQKRKERQREDYQEQNKEAIEMRQESLEQRKQQKVEAIEARAVEVKGEKAVVVHPYSSKAVTVRNATTPAGVQKLLSSLNINLDVRLTRTDTMNLLATLLTCNEAQLQTLYNNRKVPLAIKTIIKRLMEDSKLGNIDAIERLWDRIFGKAGLSVDLPQGSSVLPGIIPGQPVSREAYMVIRETIIGK